MGTPKVSVIIPTFNRAHLIVESLDSILTQSLPPHQVIVINDGSTDNTRDALRPYLSRIIYLEKENLGKATAINMGLSLVTGNYVWIFDDDDVALPDALERRVSLLEKHADIDFTYSGYHDSESDDTGRILPGALVEVPQFPEEELFVRLLESNVIPAGSLLVRTQCYEEVGPYAVEEIFAEDYEMNLRLARRFRGRPVPGATYCLRRHSGIRGSGDSPVSALQVHDARRAQNRQRALKWREELDLTSYLPRQPRAPFDGRMDRRRALFQRATIMAAHGLHSEMINDLCAALMDQRDRRPLSPAERAMFNRLACYPPPTDPVFFSRPNLSRIRQVCSTHPVGREIQFELTRGFYWRIVEYWQAGERNSYLQVMFAIAYLNLGIGFFSAVSRFVLEKLFPHK